MLRAVGGCLFACAVAAGTILDRPPETSPFSGILVADLHVHPHPVDGALTVGQLQREARRRGLDVIALTGHNNMFAWSLAGVRTDDDVLVVPGQEITSPDYHISAIGIDRVVDWRLRARDVAAAVHESGGAVIAGHPVTESWKPCDDETLAALDGVEVAHPILAMRRNAADDIERFFNRVREQRPDIAPIGSSDFHGVAPLGRYRTYLFVHERSIAGVVQAVRTGRTVAETADGRLIGTPELVQRAIAHRASRPSRSWAGDGVVALLALIGLALAAAGRDRQ